VDHDRNSNASMQNTAASADLTDLTREVGREGVMEQIREKNQLGVYTVPEVARILRISPGRCYELVRRGIVPSVRLLRQVRVTETALAEFIARGGQGLAEQSRGAREE